jgi:Homeodomain-like domain
MLHITLAPEDRTALDRLRRNASTPAPVRVRCQMLLLSADRWSPPRIAAHLAFNPDAIRAVIRRFQERGKEGLKRDPGKVARAKQTLAAVKRGPTKGASGSHSSMNAASPPANP